MAASKEALKPVVRQNMQVQGYGFLNASRWVDVVQLAANTAKTYTVPAGISKLRLTPTVIPAYGCLSGTATLPTADVTTGVASFPVGGQTCIDVHVADALSLICAANSFITIEGWS